MAIQNSAIDVICLCPWAWEQKYIIFNWRKYHFVPDSDYICHKCYRLLQWTSN